MPDRNKEIPVYFTSIRSSLRDPLGERYRKLLEKSGIKNIASKGDLVALKLHWSEIGNISYIRPFFVREVVLKLLGFGCKPFLTDTNTLYRGGRATAPDNIVTAIENGFGYSVIKAPIIIADGLRGQHVVEVKINGDYISEAKIAGEIFHAHSMVVLSHFTGHELFGFGGSLKNIGMGCATPAGKQVIHSNMKPYVKEDVCIKCHKCFSICPVEAISIKDNGKTTINKELCVGCGECVAICPVKAIPANWTTDPNEILFRTAEYALAAVKNKKDKVVYINFLMGISPECDCYSFSDLSLVPDIGIMTSLDPVALDQASLDMINKSPGITNSKLGGYSGPDKFKRVTGYDGIKILEYAEKIGLGSRKYRIENV